MAATRTFPPLYAASGDTAIDRLAFFHILKRLKVGSQPLRTCLSKLSVHSLKKGLDGSIITSVIRVVPRPYPTNDQLSK